MCGAQNPIEARVLIRIKDVLPFGACNTVLRAISRTLQGSQMEEAIVTSWSITRSQVGQGEYRLSIVLALPGLLRASLQAALQATVFGALKRANVPDCWLIRFVQSPVPGKSEGC